MESEKDIRRLLDTPDEQGRYHGYYDQGQGVNEAEKLRQDLIVMTVGWNCPDCLPTQTDCPTHGLYYGRLNRLAELAGAEAFGGDT